MATDATESLVTMRQFRSRDLRRDASHSLEVRAVPASITVTA